MSKQIQVSRFFILAILFFAGCQSLYAILPETQEKLNHVLANWRTTDSEMLKLPENADLLMELRRLAKDTQDTAAIVPLIKLGDEEVTQNTIELFKNSPIRRLSSPINQLSLGANPVVIQSLIESLMIEEKPDDTIVGGERFLTPRSVLAAEVIKSIAETSPVFTEKVKVWAQKLPVQAGDKRAAVRSWCEINKDALLRKDYAACVPVPGTQREIKRPDKPAVTPKPEQPLSKREPKERPPALTEEEGKTPIWPWLAGISTLAVLGVILWSRRGIIKRVSSEWR
jgi:hypothetical protein